MRALLAALPVLLSACAVIGEPAPPGVPTGAPPRIGGPEPLDTITVLGAGTAFDMGWRYSAFESDAGVCLQLEVGGVSSINCGRGFAPEASIFVALNYGASLGGASAADGLISDDVAELLVRATDGQSYPATVLSLGPAGVKGRGFVVFVPQGEAIESIVAYGRDGELLETYQIPDSAP